MNAKLFRNLVLFCCTAAAGLVAAGIYCYVAQSRWIEAVNTPANVASSGAVQFRTPAITVNAFYVAGLFLALGGCFSLKAAQERAALLDPRSETSFPSDEN